MDEATRSGGRELHPVLEYAGKVAAANGWTPVSQHATRAEYLVSGEWSDYRLSVSLDLNGGFVDLRCSFALAPREDRRTAVMSLAGNVSGRIGTGVVLVDSEGAQGIVTDCLALPRDGVITPDAAHDLALALEAIAHECDLVIFPIFHRVAWGAITPEAALGTFGPPPVLH